MNFLDRLFTAANWVLCGIGALVDLILLAIAVGILFSQGFVAAGVFWLIGSGVTLIVFFIFLAALWGIEWILRGDQAIGPSVLPFRE
jgi:hypothetical protein